MPIASARQSGIAATDRRIDALVYDLYGLTEKGTGIVEEATARETWFRR